MAIGKSKKQREGGRISPLSTAAMSRAMQQKVAKPKPKGKEKGK